MKISRPSGRLLTGGLFLLIMLLWFWGNRPIDDDQGQASSRVQDDPTPALIDPATESNILQRSETVQVSRSLQLKWHQPERNEVPVDLLIVGWDSTGAFFSVRSDKTGQVKLPAMSDSILLFIGTEGKAVGGIIRINFSDSEFHETITIYRGGDFQVQFIGDHGQPIPDMNVRLLFPVKQTDDSFVVPIEPYLWDQDTKYSRFLALLKNFGAELSPNLNAQAIVQAIGELPKELRGRLVTKVIEGSPNSAWIGFPYLGPIWKRSDNDGYAFWENLPTNLPLRYFVGSEGLFIPGPAPTDEYALSQIRNSTQVLHPFSGTFEVGPGAAGSQICRVVTDTSLTGELPSNASVAKYLNLDLWLLSKGKMGLDSGTSSVTLEWHLDLDEGAKFYKAPVSPGLKQVTATWYTSLQQAYFAYQNFVHLPGEQLDIGKLQVLDTPDVVFEIAPRTPEGLPIPSMAVELADALHPMIFEGFLGRIISDLSPRNGSPDSFLRIPFHKGVRFSGLPEGKWAFFPDERRGQITLEGGKVWSWTLKDRNIFVTGSESMGATVEIPLVIEKPIKLTRFVVTPEAGSVLSDNGYELGIFDSNGKVLPRRIWASFLDNEGNKVVECQLSPGLYTFVFLPKQSYVPPENMSTRVAGGVVKGVQILAEVKSGSLEIPAGVNIAGTIVDSSGTPIKRGDPVVGLIINLSGNFESKAAYVGNPAIAIPILNNSGDFRIFGLPPDSAFAGGGFGRRFVLYSEKQDTIGILIHALNE